MDTESIEARMALVDFERVFDEIKDISIKNNLDLKIITLTNHKFKSKQIVEKSRQIKSRSPQIVVKSDQIKS